MGDADEATVPLKIGTDDPSTATAPDIDVVNLSCQMTNMDLLSSARESKSRAGKKRVRFSTPEPRLETRARSAKTREYRRREAKEFLTLKRSPTCCLYRTHDKTIYIDKSTDMMDTTCDDESVVAVVDEMDNKVAKRRKRDKQTNFNSNCATKSKGGLNKCVIKTGSHTKRKIQSSSSKHKCMSKNVVSKKKGVKSDEWDLKYSRLNKRKTTDFLKNGKKSYTGEAKKRKVSHDTLKKKTCSNKLRLQHCNKYSRYKRHSSKAQIKAKQLKAKLSKAKKKLLAKKVKEKHKLSMQRKKALKCKLAKQRKAAKVKRIVKKKPRKIKIIPIEREEEVSESLRINLLKHLTIERAYDYKYECCHHYCWDKWKELDIDDVIADFD